MTLFNLFESVKSRRVVSARAFVFLLVCLLVRLLHELLEVRVVRVGDELAFLVANHVAVDDLRVLLARAAVL